MFNDKMLHYYMDVAKRTAKLSYAEKLKVGAILVKNDNIISFSYNGQPRGWNDNICEDKIYADEEQDINCFYPLSESDFELGSRFYRLKTKPTVIHAEEAMLMKVASSHESTEGSSLFCTHSCCINCAKLLYGAKIKEFYYHEEYRCNDGLEFLDKCGILVTKI